jgi:hypothetical protein
MIKTPAQNEPVPFSVLRHLRKTNLSRFPCPFSVSVTGAAEHSRRQQIIPSPFLFFNGHWPRIPLQSLPSESPSS